jgi:hypothetical protein
MPPLAEAFIIDRPARPCSIVVPAAPTMPIEQVGQHRVAAQRTSVVTSACCPDRRLSSKMVRLAAANGKMAESSVRLVHIRRDKTSAIALLRRATFIGGQEGLSSRTPLNFGD